MAVLSILCYPDARLHTVAKPVREVDGRIRQLIADMLETMYEANGVGLAATQVDVHERVIVIDTSEDRNQPLVLINPEIIWASDEQQVSDEGCLSVPGIYDERRTRRVHQSDRARRGGPIPHASRPKACSLFASSTRWTTCWARSSSNTCRR